MLDTSDEALAGNKSIVDKTGANGTDQMNDKADYSKEFEDVLDLLARLKISTDSFVDPALRKNLERTIQHSEVTNDFAAVLQLISKFELENKSVEHFPDRVQFLQQRIRAGPLTENHLFVLKLLCNSDISGTSISEESDRYTSLGALKGIEEKESFEKPLCDVMILLAQCDLKPSYLMEKNCRKLIEKNLIERKGQLLKEHTAILQLISKFEIDSDLSMDCLRKEVLEKRINEGPLNSDHLLAAQSLCQLEIAESHLLTQIPADLGSEAKQNESCEVENGVRYLADSSEVGGSLQVDIESKAPFLIENISRIEVASLLSREEKTSLEQIMELRAKSARIKQNLPEWVRNGRAPPRYNNYPPAAEKEKNPTIFANRNELQISNQPGLVVLEAQIGFLAPSALPPTELTQLQKDSPSFASNMRPLPVIDITDALEPSAGMQVTGEVVGSPTLPAKVESSQTWSFCVFAYCLTYCMPRKGRAA
jgi:hypothetical protein